jgi:solute carrier family 20 (sodium-dependent phosphate transporter)
VQVITACADSFSHGANDVANSVGPFSGIYATYKTSSVLSKTEPEVLLPSA